MSGPFRVVCADPPWRFGDALPGKSRGASKNYSTLTVSQIETFLADNAIQVADDALLFMWRVSAMVPEAYAVVRAWGFEHKSEIVWNKRTVAGKVHFGMGRYVRASHESCIIAKRGKSIIRDRGVRSTFEAATGRHSEKPEAFYDLVERLAEGPYLELFARRQRPGWVCLGNELGTTEAAE